MLKIPNTKGALPEPRWLGKSTLLTDDWCVIAPAKGPGSPAPSLLDPSGSFFQLNYSPKTARTNSDSVAVAEGSIVVVEMSRIEQAISSENARGYEDQKLLRLFKACRRKLRQSPFNVMIDSPTIGDPRCTRPLYKRSWLGSKRRTPSSPTTPCAIGDGEFFPFVEYSLDRADRPRGECGSVYEACLDEAVLLGHGARVSVTRGAKKNFDVSACLTWFYRSIHPCVPDMSVGDVMLDYEFTLHGRGELSPVYALLSHLAESCRVNCFPAYKLITLNRHRGASVWTRGADAQILSRRLRTNTIGAFLCAQDHRLATLLSRCCNPKPVEPRELREGCELLPRGDEEELLLRAYSQTLGPVFEFVKEESFPSKVRTSLGDWKFLRLASRSHGVRRYPGTTVVDGFTIAFASESPLFYVRDAGPVVQKLESAAVVVESSSLYRTEVSNTEDPEWPVPDLIDTRERIKCKNKRVVIDEMFMRSGGRDPLEGHEVTVRTWGKLIMALKPYDGDCMSSSEEKKDWTTVV
ncbi:hypothetical protein DPEC_G00068840 [Dallia pectoralis]|uniref:Uncharacterized protein n=1 Tax=Dallia pectoralis TaxID=75939 RepID=A0ACC2H1S7_DALPE|nr:hypothetical protein DPEC_G00068840 [Dallia pectoralis]